MMLVCGSTNGMSLEQDYERWGQGKMCNRHVWETYLETALLHYQWCGNFPLQLQQCCFQLFGFCSKNKFIIMLVFIVIVNNEIQNLLHWKAESFLDVLNYRDCSDSLWQWILVFNKNSHRTDTEGNHRGIRFSLKTLPFKIRRRTGQDEQPTLIKHMAPSDL